MSSMAFKNLSTFHFSLIIILSLITLTSQLQLSSTPSTTYPPNAPTLTPNARTPSAGEWTLLQKSIGIVSMHMQLLHNNKVIIFDRTDFGSSNLTLPAGTKCRYNDEVVKPECTAHSILYDVASNTYRPLTVQTDVWCSSGYVNPDGTLTQTGGFHEGDHKIRLFAPCKDDNCDWIELPQNLTVRRWYSSDQIVPDGRVIIVGGRNAFSYEFFPKRLNQNVVNFPFLKETRDRKEENNLYPFLHLLPDGNLFVFANRRSLVLDYVNNKVVREFPVIPGEKRSYPSTGSSVMLPLRLDSEESLTVEVMVCGGAGDGAYLKTFVGVYMAASETCGRLRVTDPNPEWVMEHMPMGRVMPDMLILPTGAVIILNGAANGSAGWEAAVNPALNPVLYDPKEPDPSKRFSVLNPTTIARLYHSSAALLPDGRILVGGSNPHIYYNFTGVKYPTELSLEAFYPPYLAAEYNHFRPSILSVEGPTKYFLLYGQPFSITYAMELYQPDEELIVTMVTPSFTTHSFAMNQRLIVLQISEIRQFSASAYKVMVYAPLTAKIAPPGYYMVFVVHRGVPSHSVWIRI